MEGNVGWAFGELCLGKAVSPGGRPPCRIPDHPQANGVVRKFMESMKPSSSGHKFLWKYFLYIVLHFPISQKEGEDQGLEMHRTLGDQV